MFGAEVCSLRHMNVKEGLKDSTYISTYIVYLQIKIFQPSVY